MCVVSKMMWFPFDGFAGVLGVECAVDRMQFNTKQISTFCIQWNQMEWNWIELKWYISLNVLIIKLRQPSQPRFIIDNQFHTHAFQLNAATFYPFFLKTSLLIRQQLFTLFDCSPFQGKKEQCDWTNKSTKMMKIDIKIENCFLKMKRTILFE